MATTRWPRPSRFSTGTAATPPRATSDYQRGKERRLLCGPPSRAKPTYHGPFDAHSRKEVMTDRHRLAWQHYARQLAPEAGRQRQSISHTRRASAPCPTTTKRARHASTKTHTHTRTPNQPRHHHPTLSQTTTRGCYENAGRGLHPGVSNVCGRLRSDIIELNPDVWTNFHYGQVFQACVCGSLHEKNNNSPIQNCEHLCEVETTYR